MKNETQSTQGTKVIYRTTSVSIVEPLEIGNLEELKIEAQLKILRSQLEKLRRCFENRVLPSSKEWPTQICYGKIITCVKRLDHLGLCRKRAHPFWRYALRCVNRKYPEIRLVLTIQSFVEYVSREIPHEKIPESLVALNKMVNDSHRSRVFLLSEIAFGIYKGSRKANGDHMEGLVSLCSSKFRALYPEGLNVAALIPKPLHRLIEFSAALEIVRMHQVYARKHSPWLSAFSDFLLKLENPEFHGIETGLSFFNSDRTDGFQKREQAKVRKRRRRLREKEKVKSEA